MRSFFWEGHKGGKLNHLVKWKVVIEDQTDGGPSLGSLRSRNVALLSKWGWRFLKELEALWSMVIRSIHGCGRSNWHTSGNVNVSLRSPWISISRPWLKVEALAEFRVGNGCRTIFWLDPWIEKLPLSSRFPRLFTLVDLKCTVADFWDPSTSSWDIAFRRLLEEEEIVDFMNLMVAITNKKVVEGTDKRIWSLESSGVFLVKSLVKHLSLTSPVDHVLEKGLWYTKSPRRINIMVWLMIFVSLNCVAVLQKKLLSHSLSPYICPLSLNN